MLTSLLLVGCATEGGTEQAPSDPEGFIVELSADGKADELGTLRYYLCQSRRTRLVLIDGWASEQTSYYAPSDAPEDSCKPPVEDVDLVVVYDGMDGAVDQQSDSSPVPELLGGTFSVRYEPAFEREEAPPGSPEPVELALRVQFDDFGYVPHSVEIEGSTVSFFTAARVHQTAVDDEPTVRTLELTYLHPATGEPLTATVPVDPDEHEHERAHHGTRSGRSVPCWRSSRQAPNCWFEVRRRSTTAESECVLCTLTLS